MKKRILVLCAFFMLIISTSAYAKSVSIGAKISTLGLGGEVEMKLTDSIGVRGGMNYYTYSYASAEGGIDYDIDFTLSSVPFMLDWHPFKGSFRLSAGAIFNSNELDFSASVSGGNIDIGGNALIGVDLDLDIGIAFSSVAPIVTFGWDTSAGKDRGFGFLFELGAVFQGSPDATASITGPDAGLVSQAELAAEEEDLQNALEAFTIYPVISMGLSYRF